MDDKAKAPGGAVSDSIARRNPGGPAAVRIRSKAKSVAETDNGLSQLDRSGPREVATERPVPDLLRNLESLARRLDRLDDEVSARLGALEEELRSIKLGIPVFVPWDDDFESGETTYLGFDKYNGQWRLVVSECAEPLPAAVTPLTDCPRNVRAGALGSGVLLLLRAAEEALRTEIETRLRALKTSSQVLDMIKGNKP